MLVVITGYYAWQTRAMVTEMPNARQLSLRPKIVLDLEMAGPTFGLIVVANVGAGAALHADLTIAFLTPDGQVGEERKWLEQLIVPGERHEFLPPKAAGDMNGLVAMHPMVTLGGTALDSFGQTIHVADEMFMAEAWGRSAIKTHRFQEPVLERLVREAEKSRRVLETASRDLRRVADAASRPPRFACMLASAASSDSIDARVSPTRARASSSFCASSLAVPPCRLTGAARPAEGAASASDFDADDHARAAPQGADRKMQRAAAPRLQAAD